MKALCIDIGNTYLHWAFFIDEKIEDFGKIHISKVQDFSENIGFPDEILISSNAPSFNLRVANLFSKFFGIYPKFVVHENFNMLNIPYNEKHQLGIDRLCNVFALYKFYKTPGIVIDAGTAITIDAIDEKKNVYPIAIFPGIGLLIKSMYENTERVKVKDIHFTGFHHGKSTEECLSIGIVNILKGGMERVIRQFTVKEGWKDFKKITTGGDANIISEILGFEKDEFITLKGIYGIYIENA
jgi:type III pantothenate kinase